MCHEDRDDETCFARGAAARRRRVAGRRAGAAGADLDPGRSAGTRLDISATGEVTRVPDIAIISRRRGDPVGHGERRDQHNAARMERVRAALKRAGIADRDIQTSNISLNPEYRYVRTTSRRS